MIGRALLHLGRRQGLCVPGFQRNGLMRMMTGSNDSGDSGFEKPPSSPPFGDVLSDRTEGGPGKSKSNDLFSEENTEGLWPHEIAKLRLTYGLIREHVEARRRGIDEVDPDSNPLLDPRSFDIRRLPRVADEVLEHFRRELPADVASETSPVGTRTVWQGEEDGRESELVAESADPALSWDRVDARTMTAQALNKRGRTMTHKSGGDGRAGAVRLPPPQVYKETIELWNAERRRVHVDFRSLAMLKRFLSDTSKILPKRKSGLCWKSQHRLTKAVKTARRMALLHPEPRAGPTMEELRQMERDMQQEEA